MHFCEVLRFPGCLPRAYYYYFIFASQHPSPSLM